MIVVVKAMIKLFVIFLQIGKCHSINVSSDMPLAQISIKIALESSQNACILIKLLPLTGFSGNVK